MCVSFLQKTKERGRPSNCGVLQIFYVPLISNNFAERKNEYFWVLIILLCAKNNTQGHSNGGFTLNGPWQLALSLFGNPMMNVHFLA